jgi:vitamin B12 transporter
MAKLFLMEAKNLIFSAGLRYDAYDVKVANDRGPTSAEPAESMRDQRDFKNFLPSIGVAYSPTDYLKLRANFGKGYKVPTPRQLVGNFMMGSYLYLGDPNMQPEKSTTWDVGFDFGFRDFAVSGSYFETEYFNYIGSNTLPALPSGLVVRQYTNITNANIKGFELTSRFHIGDYFNLPVEITPYFSWTHLYKFHSPDGKILPDVTKNSFGTGLDFAYRPWEFTFKIEGSYYGPNIRTGTFANQTKGGRQGGTTIWDLSITKKIISFRDSDSLSVKFSAHNLFNKYYDSSDGDIMPGASFYGALVYEIK